MEYVPLADLRSTAKNIREHLEDRAMLERLFQTAEHGQLTIDHRTAACNALCAFLLQGAKSDLHRDTSRACLSLSAWQRLLDLYVGRLQDPQSKPMKQVLDTLQTLLTASGKAAQGLEKREWAVAKSLGLVYGSDSLPSVRPAMQVLQHFLPRRTLSVSDLLSYQPSQLESQGLVPAIERTPRKDRASGVNSQAAHRDSEELSPDDQASITSDAVRNLLSNIFRWAQYRDIAPVAGKLLGSILRPVDASIAEGREPPIWVSLVLEFVQDDPTRLDMLEKYVLPELLRISKEDTANFLRGLSFVELMQGHIFQVSEIEVRLCLLAIKVSLQHKLDLELGKEISLCLSFKADLGFGKLLLLRLTGLLPRHLSRNLSSSCSCIRHVMYAQLPLH